MRPFISGYNRSYPFINWQGSTTRLPIDKGCNRLDTGPRRCIISVSLLFFLFLSEMSLCCLQFMADMSTWKIFYSMFVSLYLPFIGAIPGYTHHSLHRPVSLRPFRGAGASVDFPRPRRQRMWTWPSWRRPRTWWRWGKTEPEEAGDGWGWNGIHG